MRTGDEDGPVIPWLLIWSSSPGATAATLEGPRLGLCADAAVLDKKMELSVFGVSGCTHVCVR